MYSKKSYNFKKLCGYQTKPKKNFKFMKKRLDMPHGGIVWWNSPVRMLLKVSQCLSPWRLISPMSRLFFVLLKIPPYFDKSPLMIYKFGNSYHLIAIAIF
jgi:hypothetical protein